MLLYACLYEVIISWGCLSLAYKAECGSVPTSACLIPVFHFLLLLMWVHTNKQGPLLAGYGVNVGAW